MDDILEQWQVVIQNAQKHATPLRWRGAGTKDFYGHCEGEILDTRAYHGVVNYEPTELFITVRAGTAWADVQQVLAQQQQYIPFEPPFIEQGATVGGVINAGLAGAARLYVGGIRDYVLGAHLLNAQGQVLKFGGQVMKNVAGYDVSRLLVGSMGTLGLMTQVSLKVLPRPMHSQTVQIHCDFRQAQILCRRFLVKPIAVTATAWIDGVLTVRLAGMAAAVEAGLSLLDDWAHECCAARVVALDAADAFWQSINEQTHAYFTPPSDAHALWRAVLPTAVDGLLVHPEAGLSLWGGALRWLWLTDDVVARFKAAGGHAVCYRQAATSVVYDLTNGVDADVRVLQNAVKTQFDALNIFNRNRLSMGAHHAP